MTTLNLTRRVVFNLVTIVQLCLWEFAVRAYFPRWMLGNRLQSWWYFQNDRLLGYLLDQLERDLAIAEVEEAGQ